jgi:hypothetical protein
MEWAINCAAPEFTSVKAVEQGIKLTWNKVKGADGYRLYYRTGDTWQLIGDVRGSKDSLSRRQGFLFIVRSAAQAATAKRLPWQGVGKML